MAPPPKLTQLISSCIALPQSTMTLKLDQKLLFAAAVKLERESVCTNSLCRVCSLANLAQSHACCHLHDQEQYIARQNAYLVHSSVVQILHSLTPR